MRTWRLLRLRRWTGRSNSSWRSRVMTMYMWAGQQCRRVVVANPSFMQCWVIMHSSSSIYQRQSSGRSGSSTGTHLFASLSLPLCACACVCGHWDTDGGWPAAIYDEIGDNKQHEMKTDTTARSNTSTSDISLRVIFFINSSSMSVCLPSSVSVKLPRLWQVNIIPKIDWLWRHNNRCAPVRFVSV